MCNQPKNTAPAVAAVAAPLNLSAEEFEALRRNGYVVWKARGRRGGAYQLRFRLHGKQIARYLGSDPHRAEQVREMLSEIQRPRQIERRLRQNIELSKRIVQDFRLALEAWAHDTGCYFHGRTLRRRTFRTMP